MASCCSSPAWCSGVGDRRLGLGLLIAGIALLWVCGAPLFAERSLRILEVGPPSSPLTGTGAGAIVVLSGGTYISAPEYGSDTVGPWTLERLRYAARLYRQTSLPVLVTGGPTLGAHSSEAEQMRDALEQDFGTPVTMARIDRHGHVGKREREREAAARGRHHRRYCW